MSNPMRPKPALSPIMDRQELNLDAIVAQICAAEQCDMRVRARAFKPLPSRDEIIQVVELLRAVIFPRCFGPKDLDQTSLPFHVGSTIDKIYHQLKEQIHRGRCFECDGTRNECMECELTSEEVTIKFMNRVPIIAKMLAEDVRATYEGDPAATSGDEVVFSYPGISATLCYRIAHELYLMDSKIIARIITEYAHSTTGIDIHPGATIGPRFMIDHGTGVVIGETTEIGESTRIYQGVTLGAKSFPLDEHGNPIKGIKRHPNIGRNVIIYSGATILGPVIIGDGAVIGGNVWLTESVPAGARVLQTRARQELFNYGEGI
jgi:serine O-acetyltransferase